MNSNKKILPATREDFFIAIAITYLYTTTSLGCFAG